ncbi:MAG: hypothetical protein WKF85_03045 [Chitinophagaceae bacterium]
MDTDKQSKILNQYIDQYQPTISSTLIALRANKNNLHIPYAQFLFSVIDYYGLLYTVATARRFDKRNPQNFKDFIASDYFPKKDRCKGSFLYFIRNGLIHQIFAKGSGVGTSASNTLFYKDTSNGDNATLNLNYLDSVSITAIESFINDLKTNTVYIDNLFDLLITTNYGFNDHAELTYEIVNSFGGDMNKVFQDCA